MNIVGLLTAVVAFLTIVNLGLVMVGLKMVTEYFKDKSQDKRKGG